MRKLTYCQAINEALTQMMQKDKSVFTMGLGVDDPKAVFGTTKGLLKKFGKSRVFDTPIAENGMTGVAIGAALTGMRPIITHQRVDFMLYSLDQIINHAAKWSYMFGGCMSVPVVIRAIIGRGWGQGSQHSQSLQALFMHIPGLKVVMPSTPYDVKGLLVSSIKDNNPVIFMEHRRLYDQSGNVPQKLYAVPLGKAKKVKNGKDLTIVATSHMVLEACRAAKILKAEGIEVEVVDLRTVKPIDKALIFDSIKKTGRLIVADTGWSTCGVAAEVAALVSEGAFKYLKAPIRRITLPETSSPTSCYLEQEFYPTFEDIVIAARNMLSGKAKKHKSKSIKKHILSNLTEDIFIGPF